MSYGSYDNQSPLNQPFNPTASNGNGNGNDIGNDLAAVGNIVIDKLFGQGAQGPLSSIARRLPGQIMNNVVRPAADRMSSGQDLFNDNLPGAPQTPQQQVDQSQQSGGILKLRQQPPMLGQQPGGKSGKSFQPASNASMVLPPAGTPGNFQPGDAFMGQPVESPGNQYGGGIQMMKPGGPQFGGGKYTGPPSMPNLTPYQSNFNNGQ